jgi:hypothetical protein
MAFENGQSLTLVPSTAAISQYRFVKMGTSGEISHAGNAGDAIGVALQESVLNDQTEIAVAMIDGATKCTVEAGAGVTVGDRIMSDASGRVITATGATARVLGWALATASNAGEYITVLLQKQAGEFVS